MILILVLGFGFYWYALNRDTLIYGVDGPYYLIQVRSILERGQLKYGDPPLAFFIFTFFTLIFGGDATLGVRVAAALFSALSAVPFYFWIKRVTHSKISGYMAALACIFASPHVWLLSNFLKNAVGAFFLICFLYFLHCLVVGKGGKRILLTAALFLVLTGMTHVLDFAAALLFLIFYAIAARLMGVIVQKEVSRNIEILFLTALFFAMLVPIAFPFFFSDFYEGVNLIFSLFFGGRGAMISVMLPFNPPTRFLFDWMGGVYILPALLVGIALWVYEWKRGSKEVTVAIATVTIVAVIFLLPFIPADLLWRLLLMEFVPIAFVIGYGFSKIQGKIAISILMLFLCFFPMILESFTISNTFRSTISIDDYYEIETLKGYIPSKSVLLVNPFYRYWIEYITRLDVPAMFTPDIWFRYEHVIVLVDKVLAPSFIPPNATQIFDGRRFALYEVKLPER